MKASLRDSESLKEAFTDFARQWRRQVMIVTTGSPAFAAPAKNVTSSS